MRLTQAANLPINHTKDGKSLWKAEITSPIAVFVSIFQTRFATKKS